MFTFTPQEQGISVGTGYAIWTGIGAVGTAILGVILFAEPVNAPRVMCIALIVAGIVGLKLTSGNGEDKTPSSLPSPGTPGEG